MPFISTMESLTATGTATLTNKTISDANNTITHPPQITSFSPSDPAGTTSTAALVMMGLAMAFTPSKSGKIKIWLTFLGNQTATDGIKWQLRYGTGTAPVNGAALTGTATGRQINQDQSGTETGGVALGFVTGLTLSTAYWIDLAVAAKTGGTAAPSNIFCVVEEPQT